MSFHEQSTIEWYVAWLAENRPDLDESARLEMATGFVVLQNPVTKAATVSDTDEQLHSEVDARAAQRKHDRLTRAQLEKITGVKL